jgi:hypothetical protein
MQASFRFQLTQILHTHTRTHTYTIITSVFENYILN